MGQFRVPAAEDSDKDDEELYDAIVMFYEDQNGHVEDERIEGIKFYDDHPSQEREIDVDVGETFPLNGETVQAIIHDGQRGIYCVCTASRGVLEGMPFLIGSDETIEIRHFD